MTTSLHPNKRAVQAAMNSTLTRRQLLQSTASLATSLAISQAASHGAWRATAQRLSAAAPTADQLVPGKDRRLIVHTPATTGFEFETPLELLRAEQITPIDKLFVRNNQQPPWAATLEPFGANPEPFGANSEPFGANQEPSAKARPWELAIGGLTEFPRTISLDEIKSLPAVEHEMVLQCSGNGRALFAPAAPVKGAAWTMGAMGNVRFKGATLKSVFEKFDVRPHESARFLTAEGIESPTKREAADFEHSLPLEDVLDRSILAWELNGKPIPAVHGGPLRLVTPGYYGTMHVKWLFRLRLEAQETVNHHQSKRYRTPRTPLKPGAEFDYRLDNSDANWRMRIKSVIFSPARDATLGPSDLQRNQLLATGVAWNDGVSAIDAVEVSIDNGQTWKRAELQRSSRYAWHPWQIALPLPPGKHTIISRAIDTLGNSQPLDGAIGWNPAGYCWHGADRVSIHLKA